ncbi:hypothetical protein DLD77_01295 [Chitinophaga alhagiae]|uniref:Peptidase S74 domain-containing protein n=1 Tax=Chitinophaga alhagiae TaxID=2203219 RepID=A0ABN5LM21_9BACT|nr:hypothetical protein [Chitinophaga alhagiae]AWO00436.1 hypothetical protein DLD77_01295 [Chitinophaga alhagiae]
MIKKTLLSVTLLLIVLASKAQVFTQQLQVTNNNRDYYVNRAITGETSESIEPTYILLHKAYAGVFLEEHHVMGKITAIRGGVSAWNRKWTVEVNTSAASNQTRGTLITYNETSRLVTLVYNSISYLAAEIGTNSLMGSITFTGYARNEMLTLVTHQQVSNVQPFSNLSDIISLNGRTVISDPHPSGNLVVIGPGADVNAGSGNLLSNGLVVMATTTARNATKGAQIEFAIPRDASGNCFGQGRILTVAGDGVMNNLTGKMLIGTRRAFNKAGGGVQWYYGDDIVIDGTGNVGIGTLTPQAKLAVNGDMFAKKVKVTATGWSDFVFDPSYKLPSLYEIERFIKANRHLPDIPTEAEVKEKGIDVGEMNKLLLQKIEEQMLYIIELRKEVDGLKKAIKGEAK